MLAFLENILKVCLNQKVTYQPNSYEVGRVLKQIIIGLIMVKVVQIFCT